MQESTETTTAQTALNTEASLTPIDIDKVEEQMLLDEKFLNLVIVDLNKREINLKMVQYEMVLELREFLNEHVYTCFFTHYSFVHMDKQLNDYTELAELDLIADPRIYMKAEKYDEKSARQHIRRVKEILSSPPVLTSQVDNGIGGGAQTPTQQEQDQQQEEKDTKQKQEDGSDDQNTQQENKEDKQGTEEDNNQAPSTPSSSGNPMTKSVGNVKLQKDQEARLKKNYEDFMAIIEKESKKEIPMPPKNGLHLLRDLFTNQIEAEMNHVQNIKCVESIQFSSYNPIPPYRKMVGDLFYLVVKTVDAGEHGITCNVNGFYRNGNIEKNQFNPLPTPQSGKGGSACYSYTLVGCLYQISTAFGKNLEQYINSILNTEPYFLTQPALPVNFWITQEDKNINNKIVQQAKDWNAELNSTLVPLYGLDPKGIRDWNEEFQVVKDFPKDGFMQRIQRDRAVSKVYNDFLDAATKGAIAIVNGNLMPLNPNESEKQQVFVYNYIFFSFAVDLIDSFKDLTSSENNPSFTQANHDIMGLRTLQILDIEGLHILATCLVQYKGHRVIAQSIIPGILNNNDLTSLAEYGSVDEQKTLYASENFHSLMKKVCDHLNIKVNKVIDGAQKEVEIAGSVEVKGIKGTDKRSYLVDLQGLTPRDANYKGDDNHTCLLRPELLMIFQRTKNLDYASAKMQEEHKKQEQEKEQAKKEETDVQKTEEQKETTDAEKEEQIKKRQEENFKKLREFDRFIKEAPKYQFNTNVFKNVKFAMPEDEVAKDEALVEEIAKFLKENAIDRLVKDLQNIEGVPTDSESLETTFHQHGVNMRYLGAVADIVKESDLNHFKILLEKEVVLRSLKHIFNEQLRDSSNLYLSSVITHILNLTLAPFPMIQLLNEGKINFVDNTIQAQLSSGAQASSQSQQDQHTNASPQKQKEEKPQQDQETKGQDDQAKTDKKKNKKKSKQQQQQQQTVSNGKSAHQDDKNKKSNPSNCPSNLNEMLFKQLGEGGVENVPFSLDELFKNNEIAKGLIKIEQPEILNLKPAQLYERIKSIALKRYSYTLPETQVELKCLESANNKLSILRDICTKIGIKMLSHKHRDYILDNDTKILHNKLAESQQQQQLIQQQENANKTQGKKKGNQQQQQYNGHQIDLTQITSYNVLPFQIGDVVELFPVLKHLDLQNNDVRALLQSAKSSYKDGYYEKAFELYSQCINSLLQITGPMNKDVAACISKLASIQFKFGDFLQAIELQTKSIILQERLLGYDHPQTAYSYSNLALYHHTCGYFSKAFEYMYRSLNILKIVCGENHPDISSIYLNLGLMYQDIENFQAAIDCFLESLYRYIALFGESHIQVGRCYQAIAQAYFQLSDYRKALENQEKAHKILVKTFPADDPNVKDSLTQIDQFMKLSVYVEKFKNAEKNQRSIGQNKPTKQNKQGEAASKGNTQRMNSLFQRLQDPKNRNLLDILEYNHLRQQQSSTQQIIKDQLDEAMKQGAEGQTKQEDVKGAAKGSTTTTTETTTKSKK